MVSRKLARVDRELQNIILSKIPKEYVDAIFVFGSYGTEDFKTDSDLDIGCYCQDWFNGAFFVEDCELDIEELLGVKVHITVFNKDTDYELLTNILSGDNLYSTKEFNTWLFKFNAFVMYNSDLDSLFYGRYSGGYNNN